MYAIFPTRKRSNVKRTESKLYTLVERKEMKEKAIDEQGRSLVMSLREYLANPKSMKYNTVMKKAKHYIKKNQDYY